MIIQRKKAVDITQSPRCTPDTQSLNISSAADETFVDWSAWPQGPATGLMHSNSLGPHPIELCRQLTPIPDSPESPTPSDSNRPSSNTTYLLAEISTIAKYIQKSHTTCPYARQRQHQIFFGFRRS